MGSHIGQENVDFIDELKGVVNLAGRILSLLDINSLGRAEQVSKTWRKAIIDGNIWQACLERELHQKPSSKQIYQRLMAEPKSDLPSDAKKVLCQVQKMSKVLDRNWRKGSFVVRGKRIKNENPKNSSEFILVDSNCIYLGLKSCGSIKVLNRKSLEFEKEFPPHGPGLAFLLMLDSETLLSASRKDGLIKVWDKSSRKLLHTVTVPLEESAVITELQTSNGLVVAAIHTTSGDPWVDSKSTLMAWRASPSTKELTKVHEETITAVSIHHLGLDANYIALMYLKEGRRNNFDLNLSPGIEFRSTKTFRTLLKVPHGLEEVYEFKFVDGLLAVGSRIGIRIWDIKNKTHRDITDDRMVDGCGVSVYGFNSKFIVGHLFSGPVLIWDLEAALKDPKRDSKSLLVAELKMRFDPDIKMDELEFIYLRRPHMQFLDEAMEEYDAGDHFEVIVRDFSADGHDYQQCSEPCCLSDDDDYEM